MPDGYGVPDNDEGLLNWEQVNEWLEQTKVFWIGTTRPDGRPHAIPIWGAWVENCFYFDGSPETRWARNIATNPGIVVHIERGDVAVMVDGTVEGLVPGPEVHSKIRESYGSRYDYVPKEGEIMYKATPKVAFAWADFPRSVTKFRFGAK
jgi:nitroimidazol reductase NimA-like FMN-containing flavoprotein (pyridoxamine 5'-phosphate oxidase superfamily)